MKSLTYLSFVIFEIIFLGLIQYSNEAALTNTKDISKKIPEVSIA